jgi:hypothetical protein
MPIRRRFCVCTCAAGGAADGNDSFTKDHFSVCRDLFIPATKYPGFYEISDELPCFREAFLSRGALRVCDFGTS